MNRLLAALCFGRRTKSDDPPAESNHNGHRKGRSLGNGNGEGKKVKDQDYDSYNPTGFEMIRDRCRRCRTEQEVRLILAVEMNLLQEVKVTCPRCPDPTPAASATEQATIPKVSQYISSPSKTADSETSSNPPLSAEEEERGVEPPRPTLILTRRRRRRPTAYDGRLLRKYYRRRSGLLLRKYYRRRSRI